LSNKSFFAGVVFLVLLAATAYSVVALYRYQNQLTDLNKQIVYLDAEISNLDGEISDLKEQLQDSQAESSRLHEEIYTLHAKIPHVRDPTIQELKAFLARDPTDKHPYVPGVYMCMHFARDLQSRAAAYNINIYYVGIWFSVEGYYGRGHYLNGARLSDGRWVWIEPELDKIYFGTIEDYCMSFFQVPRSGISFVHVHECTPFDTQTSYTNGGFV